MSLDAKTGKERWHKQIGSVKENYFSSASPTIVKNHLIVGLSGDTLDVPAWIESRNPETGELEWKWYTTPKPGTPEAATWPSADAMKHGGGMTWQPVTYDPKLNLIYVATGNPQPDVRAGTAQGRQPVLLLGGGALYPDTGQLVWYYQTSANEAWDFDTNQVPVLFDATAYGKSRKLVAQATRNGLYFLLDRSTGEHILTSRVAELIRNRLTGFDAQGKAIRNPAKLNQPGGALISPSNGGIQQPGPARLFARNRSALFQRRPGLRYPLHLRPARRAGRHGPPGPGGRRL